MKDPTVSVIVAAYNSACFISRAINSVINQSMGNWELIIVDDCSEDQTEAVVKKFADGDTRITYARTDKNSGPSRARNVGISMARGTWIAILDSDDAFQTERLERLITIAELNNLDFIADNVKYYDKTADEIIGNAYKLHDSTMDLTIQAFLSNCGPGRYFSFSLLKPIVKMDFLRTNCINYDESIRVGEDFQFILSALWNGARAAILSEAMYVYTMPFGLKSRRRSTATRTDHSLTGLGAMVSAKQRALDYAMSSAPDRQVEIAALSKLVDEYQSEQNWQTMLQYIRSTDLRSAMQAAKNTNIIRQLAKKLYYKFVKSQHINQ